MARINIGLDIGNYDIKTRSTSTASGYSQYSKKPFSTDEYLYFNGTYYVPRAERFPYQRDKTVNENAFILSLFGIAKEILYRCRIEDNKKRQAAQKAPEKKELILGLQSEIDKYNCINLGVGVPPIHYTTLRDVTIKYYIQNFSNGIDFIYSGFHFHLCLNRCDCYPQDAAAVVGYVPKRPDSVIHYKGYYAVDIGGQTVDALTFIDGRIDFEKCDSKLLGVLAMYEKIIKDIEMNTGKRISRSIIEDVLLGEATILQNEIIELIKSYSKDWFYYIIDSLTQFGLDFDMYPVLFLGGGSMLFRPFIENYGFTKFECIENPNANAIGYEKMIRRQIKRG